MLASVTGFIANVCKNKILKNLLCRDMFVFYENFLNYITSEDLPNLLGKIPGLGMNCDRKAVLLCSDSSVHPLLIYVLFLEHMVMAFIHL